MVCADRIYSEDYEDHIVEYYGDEQYLYQKYLDACFQIVSERYAIAYTKSGSMDNYVSDGSFIIPHCYGLMSSEQVLESSGILRTQRQPALSLFGQGVMIGFIDTGIDYTHPAFLGSDNTTRIYSIWDQSIEPDDTNKGRIPEGFAFGQEYTREDINDALSSDNPWEIVPSRDLNGHGTFAAGVACGSSIESKAFSGVAPLADICVVKCKEAKNSLKRFYRITTNEPVYAENDILLAVRYLWETANKRNRPLVICLGLGTSMGGHEQGGVLGRYLQTVGDYRGVTVVTSCGNEANTSHHYRSDMVSPGTDVQVEVRVGSNNGFMIELWSEAPYLYAVALTSPNGEYSGKIQAGLGEKRHIDFILDDTVVDVEYLLFAYESGDECIQIRFDNPSVGIWNIRVFNENDATGFFDMWLPIRNFLPETTYFLKADPDVTLCDPSNNTNLISASYYNSSNRSVAINSSRGYTRLGYIKPDIASPGIDVYGPLPYVGNKYPGTEEERMLLTRFGYMNGSSGACAVTAGAAALLLEWGIVRKNDISMNTVKVQKYLIRGADASGMSGVNRLWGNGTLYLYGVFESLISGRS